jgi:mRNA-degrading endonuclease toxin of MazEF toxin-antitoxin module
MDSPKINTAVAREKVEALLAWTKLKIRVCSRPDDEYRDEGAVWWAHVGENVGSEQNGKNQDFDRPVLIVKKVGPTMVWVVPLTSKAPRRPWLLPLTTNRPGSVIISQLRSISSKRLIRFLMQSDAEEYAAVRGAISELLK